MPHARLPEFRDQVENHVSARTGRRIRDLTVELTPERVVIRGETLSYYVKQLAQHGVRELIPDLDLENSIVVRSYRDTVPEFALN